MRARPNGRTSGELGQAVDYILHQARAAIAALEPKTTRAFVRDLSEARRVFVYGAGRSGMVARSFAVRLAHLGYTVYVIGETVAAPVQKGDVVVLVSGSGETYPVSMTAEIAKNIGARVLVLTANARSKVASFGDVVLEVAGEPSAKRDPRLAPLGTLFETTTWVFLDGVVAELMARRHQTEEMLRQRHATME
jgi:6-phospho 3-hexuloisomerase